jgi:hypothetical protein
MTSARFSWGWHSAKVVALLNCIAYVGWRCVASYCVCVSHFLGIAMSLSLSLSLFEEEEGSSGGRATTTDGPGVFGVDVWVRCAVCSVRRGDGFNDDATRCELGWDASMAPSCSGAVWRERGALS